MKFRELFDITYYDGAGLSRKNRISANEMMAILKYTKKYKDIFPRKRNRIYEKSGTLTGVSVLAGYTVIDEVWSPFTIMINSKVKSSYRFKLACKINDCNNIHEIN